MTALNPRRGFLSELGPFYPTATAGRLQANPYTWTATSNIVFLESPAFVGWSYSNTTSDEYVGDARTAADALRFLLGFFERFPVYDGRPFWIAGESYGGGLTGCMPVAKQRSSSSFPRACKPPCRGLASRTAEQAPFTAHAGWDDGAADRDSECSHDGMAGDMGCVRRRALRA